MTLRESEKQSSILESRPSKPVHRPRRLRATTALRAMVRETELNARDFIYPLFVRHGAGRNEIRSMPGVYQLSVAEAVREAENAMGLGVNAVILFGIPREKDPIGLENFAEDGIIQQAIRAIKNAIPEMVVVTDVCLCEYTDHGHCGILNTGEHFQAGLPECGADIVAPSGMLDGMVSALRGALDERGFENTPILSYAVKYASSFYGPFREAAEGAPKFGDRKSHQMDPANVREALREAALDVDEGADMLMVKPALAYLDVIRVVKDAFPELPMAAYNVSGEYSMIKAAAANGWIDEAKVTLETLTAMKRAGADLILTYHALEAANWLK